MPPAPAAPVWQSRGIKTQNYGESEAIAGEEAREASREVLNLLNCSLSTDEYQKTTDQRIVEDSC